MTNLEAPLVSVIVTNRNYAPFLESCIASVIGQTYPRIKCIVVDDASRDESVEILNRLLAAQDLTDTGRSLQVIKSRVNRGQIGTAAAGFKKATGNYVIFLDADDIMLPQCIEAHITAFLYSRYAVAISSVDMFYARGSEILTAGHGGFVDYITSGAGQRESFCRKIKLPFAIARPDVDQPFALALAELHHVPWQSPGWVWGATSALCFRREVVVPMLNCAPDLKGFLDRHLLRGIHPFTGSILIDRPLVIYRLHETNGLALFPRVENLINYKAERSGASYNRAEIIATLLANAEFYAKYLLNDDLFLQAVEKLYPNLWRSKFSDADFFSRREFLTTHQARLREAFGEAAYQRWMRPYTMAGRVIGLLRQAGLLRMSLSLLNATIGTAGLARLRGRFLR